MGAAVILAAVALCAQPPPPSTSIAISEVKIWQLAQDIMLLSQIHPLNLSAEQVRSLLRIYQTAPRPSVDEEAMKDLEQIRAKLLKGEEIDINELKDVGRLMRSAMRPGFGGRIGAPQLLQQILSVLAEWQKVVLANPWSQFTRLVIRQAGQRPLLEGFLQIAEADEAQWPTLRRQLQSRVVEAAGANNEQVAEVCGEFLDRVHGMDEQQVRSRIVELIEEADAIADTPVPVSVLFQPIDEQRLMRRASQIFLNPRMPGLLTEMAKARGWKLEEGDNGQVK